MVINNEEDRQKVKDYVSNSNINEVLEDLALEDQYVTYGQALVLRDLGFNQKCLGCYTYKIETRSWELNYVISNNDIQWILAAPLKQQALKWFRDVHELPMHIRLSWNEKRNGWGYILHINDPDVDEKFYLTYEQAESEGIWKMIRLIKTEKS